MGAHRADRRNAGGWRLYRPHRLAAGRLQGPARFRGKGRYSDAELDERVQSAAALGWQMGLHAIGDAAIVQTVNAYAKALDARHLTSTDHRWFLGHFTIMPPAAMET
jgi:predicted amidohydrolase YtcJ